MELEALEYWNDYELEVLSGLPDRGADYVFCQPRKAPKPNELVLEVPSSSADWLTLKVKPSQGASWIGSFEPGVEGVSGLYATPSESSLCVVVKGQGYWIPVNSPADYEIIPSFPIKRVVAVPKAQIMLFVDYVRLVAYGANGLIWKTGGLSWDGLKLKEVTESTVKGVGWDAPNNQEVEFSVTVSNGAWKGGSSPDLYPTASNKDVPQ